jgi:uncharacterized protein
METSVITVLLTACLSVVIIVANQQEKTKNLEALGNVLLLLLAGGMALIGGLTLLSAYNPRPNAPVVDVTLAAAFFAASLITALICLAIVLSRPLRVFLQRSIIRSDQHSSNFNADSYVHMTALVFMVIAVFNTAGNFALAGGVEGMAESMQETGMGVSDLLSNMLLYLAMALLGVGLLQRRNIQETWKRLGLSFSLWHLIVGFFVGFGLFWVQVGMGIIWQSLVSPEILSEQTAAAEQIFASFSDSLWLGFLVALTAGIGEELLFRGALQPIFGNILVSLFFVMLHSQYILTPASLIILVVSLVFGLLRQHYSTSAAIVAHIVYNFTPFVMVFLASQMGISI